MRNGINKISVYGDSILKGAVTGTGSGHLFDVIEENSLNLAEKALGFELNNQSAFGSVISKAQRKLNGEIERGREADLAIIESGGNDCDYDWNVVCASPFEAHAPRVPLADFIRIVDEMVRVCRENKITPLVMTMPPIVADRWFAHICSGRSAENIMTVAKNGAADLYRHHEIYNMSLIKYCYQNNVQFIDMRLAMLETDDYSELMCADGIHPNRNGYKYMAAIWESELPKVRKEL